MSLMRFSPIPIQVFLPLLIFSMLSAPVAGQDQDPAAVREVVQALNRLPMVDVSERNRSYEVLFDALLDLTDPPQPVGTAFNLNTIHAGMPGWGGVSNWAEANPQMAEAIMRCERRLEIALPYGKDNVKDAYQRAGLYADIGSDGSLHTVRFPYLEGFNRISAYATAEIYRRMEAGETQAALDLHVATLFVLRQLCNREFLDEKLYGIVLLTNALANLRDVFHVYREQISAEQYTDIAVSELPFLRPDRNRLLMPEGDRTVAEAILKQVFDHRGQADRYKFPEVFGAIQSRDEPLTRFGAARRWQMIAEVHGSLDASLEKFKLIYDDWWRRWRVQEYDPILAITPQYARVNAVRYAAVIHTIRNIDHLFDARLELVLAVNGTAVAAGLCAYDRTFGNFPSDIRRIYGQFIRKASNVDPYHQDYDPLRYLFANQRKPIDTPTGRIWVEPGNGILYSLGRNRGDELAATHTDDGSAGDIVIWPPVTALMREQGLID